MKSIAIFQLNGVTARLIDGLYTSIEKAIEAYKKRFGEGIIFVWKTMDDIPINVLNASNISDADIEMMKQRETKWATTTSVLRYAQQLIDEGLEDTVYGVYLTKIANNCYQSYPFIIEVKQINV